MNYVTISPQTDIFQENVLHWSSRKASQFDIKRTLCTVDDDIKHTLELFSLRWYHLSQICENNFQNDFLLSEYITDSLLLDCYCETVNDYVVAIALVF